MASSNDLGSLLVVDSRDTGSGDAQIVNITLDDLMDLIKKMEGGCRYDIRPSGSYAMFFSSISLDLESKFTYCSIAC